MAKKKAASVKKRAKPTVKKLVTKSATKITSKLKTAAPKDLKANLEKAIKTDRKAVEESISQVKELAKYLSGNWKKVLPSIAALGASAYFMKKRQAKKTKTK